MNKLSQLSSTINKALCVAVPVLALAACSGDDGRNGLNGADGAPGQDAVNATVQMSGVVFDGPVEGGSINVVTAAGTVVATITRNRADGEFFQINVEADHAGEALFLDFDATGAMDTTFNDTPFNMSSVAVVGNSGTSQRINITPQTTMVAQIVRAQLAGGETATEIEALVDAAVATVVAQTEDFQTGDNILTALDNELLEGAATDVGAIIRTIAGAAGITLNDAIIALTADLADGAIDGVAAVAFSGLTAEQTSALVTVNSVNTQFSVTDLTLDTPVRSPLHTADKHLKLAEGLEVDYLTRTAGHHADQFSWYPLDNPTHQVWCIENGAEEIAAGKLNPGVQRIELATGNVETIIRGMARCDGIRTTPWGTILATEETGDGAAYEILAPLTTTELTIAARGGAGEAATIVDAAGNATDLAVKRTALPTIAWEGLFVLPNGVVVAGDELRPGSYELTLDNAGTEANFGGVTDGGAIFKFIPATLHNGAAISALSESPLVTGSTYALQASCRDNRPQFGQGCEIGNASWLAVNPDNAREEANIAGATGYYRPEDMHLDPDYVNPDNADAVRFCWANTGNRGAQNWGEVICGIDSSPATATADLTVSLNRFIEGDSELNAPDNLAFQPGTGILYVIEDNQNGDVWACLPDGDDQGLTSDGCVRVLSLNDRSAEPSGFAFNPDGTQAWLAIQHSGDDLFPLVDDFRTDDIVHITGFSVPSQTPANRTALAKTDSRKLFGFGTPLSASSTGSVDRRAALGANVADGFGFGTDASDYVELADGLTAKFLSRNVSEWWDQHDFYPNGDNPTHLIGCIEETRGIVNGGITNKFKPSVQSVSLADGTVKTILRGMTRCDGIRTTPWGTILATEESGDGAAYEILNPLTTENLVVTTRGIGGENAVIVQGNADGTFDGTEAIPTSAVVTDLVAKRTDLPTMAWEGLFVLASGVVVGGDELRPGSFEQHFLPDGTRSDDNSAATALLSNNDTIGGAIFKFIPETPRTSTDNITALTESPLVAGSTFAMQVSCRDSRQQAGQGCEVGNAAWIAVDEDNARVSANDKGATGYYRPEDLHIDPSYTAPSETPNAVRFCWANTGNTGADNHGEIICGIDFDPLIASQERTVVVNRFVEGDGDFAAPDNLDFQPNSGVVYVIEDRSDGDVWACLPDGADRDIKTDACVKMLSIVPSADATGEESRSAEPTGFMFHPDGKKAYIAIQHAAGVVSFDDTDTDDLIVIEGFGTSLDNANFGTDFQTELHGNSQALFGFEGPLTSSSTLGQ